LELTCENGATYDVVVVPGRGNWTPALVTDSNQVIVPFSFDITVAKATCFRVGTAALRPGKDTTVTGDRPHRALELILQQRS
jgi:hypothetical protein